MGPVEDAELTSGSGFWATAAVGDVPAVVLTDGPHGVRKQAGGASLLTGSAATCFPPAVATASTWDRSLLRRMGAALGAEARALGVGVLLGPGINLKRSPLNGRNFEYFSEDPLLTGALAAEWVLGVQGEGVGASLKHFAVNSQETDRMTISADVDERTLRELYLSGFERVVRTARPWTVMCSYNRVNGVHAANNRWLLTDVLRGEWGFDGLVVSDWGAVVDRVASVAAGLDLTMPGPDPRGDADLVRAVADGDLDPELLATSAQRVRALAERAAPADPGETFDADAHHALAREIAGRAIVLLKNEGGLLPLATAGQSIAVIGEFARTPRYQGGGSSLITPTRLDDALAAITAATSAPVTFAPGYGEGASVAEAARVAAAADVAVLFVGTDQETEGADRTDIDLPATHLELLEHVVAANPRTVVVLSNGGVLRTPWDTTVPALVEAWLLGQAGGSATADVLFGTVNPSGRLAETIPHRLADHPSYLDFPGEAGHVRYGEGIHVGYRGFDAREQDVAYPFGFGLSYTTFTYGQATATADENGIDVRVPITNTGDRAGHEVVQLYLSLPTSRVRRAPRELKAFEVVELARAQTVEVLLHVPRRDLAFWDPTLTQWAIEGGDYHVAVGASSRDLRTTTTVPVPGDGSRIPLTADSTIAQWFAHPEGARLLEEALAPLTSNGGPLSGMPLRELAGGMPLSRLTRLLPTTALDQAIATAVSRLTP
ncbi:glycosyl hydrolase [Actinokineospora bangkokensis]|uniref:Exo-alpha-(1->6)-L-arabinopyranosidase n=1 Tax=Actinokineospora bangkokensis TaxID=1193682 RepID=A0A1Q9LLF9_9PSEU|nr:glycosyl hydrolase [Actinokineospora bangkokensis]